jgi:hypothetical protein
MHAAWQTFAFERDGMMQAEVVVQKLKSKKARFQAKAIMVYRLTAPETQTQKTRKAQSSKLASCYSWKKTHVEAFWSLLLLLAAEEASHVAACTLCALGDLAGTGLSTGAQGTGVAAVVALASSLGAIDAFFGDVVTDGL